MAFTNDQVLSKLSFGGVEYNLKDAEARTEIISLLNNLKTAAYKDAVDTITGSNEVPTDAAVKTYIDTQLGTLSGFDVVIDETGTETTGPSIVAGPDTMYKIYLVPSEDGTFYSEWITFSKESVDAPDEKIYSWEKIGSTQTKLEDYVPIIRKIAGLNLEADISVTQLQNALALGSLAYKNEATGTITVNEVENINFIPEGSISFTEVESEANIEYIPFIPSGDVEIELANNTFDIIDDLGSIANFSEGAFTPAELSYDNSKQFATAGLVGEIQGESLIFTPAETNTASIINSFTGGSKESDSFTPNTLPTKKSHNVNIQNSAFVGQEVNNVIVSKVKYNKVNSNDIQFEGTEATIIPNVVPKNIDITVQ